ncbi:hypothetical protein MKW98_006894, partial [Papaver atlanticum]
MLAYVSRDKGDNRTAIVDANALVIFSLTRRQELGEISEIFPYYSDLNYDAMLTVFNCF